MNIRKIQVVRHDGTLHDKLLNGSSINYTTRSRPEQTGNTLIHCAFDESRPTLAVTLNSQELLELFPPLVQVQLYSTGMGRIVDEDALLNLEQVRVINPHPDFCTVQFIDGTDIVIRALPSSLVG